MQETILITGKLIVIEEEEAAIQGQYFDSKLVLQPLLYGFCENTATSPCNSMLAMSLFEAFHFLVS